MSKLAIISVATVVLLAVSGCTTDKAPGPATNQPPSETAIEQKIKNADIAEILEENDLGGLFITEVIDKMDRQSVSERSKEFTAVVKRDTVVFSDVESGKEIGSEALPNTNKQYVSIAPYVSQTHDCHYHSLTTCTGEMGDTAIHIKIVNETNGEIVLDSDVKTFENGFYGVWLDVNHNYATTVTYKDYTGSLTLTTDIDSATCVTNLQLKTKE